MTIFEQILAGLQTKFPGVDTATLTRIATKKAEGVTDDTKVNSIVEGISFSDVLNNYGDFRAGQAQVSAVSNYEKKHGLKDGKPAVESVTEPPEPDEKPDIAKLIADGITAAMKPFSDKIAQYEAREAQAQRNAQISSVAKKYEIPDFMLKDRSIPENTDLEAYFKDVKQELINAGFQETKLPETSEQRIAKENHEIAEMIAEGTKEIVKQNQ